MITSVFKTSECISCRNPVEQVKVLLKDIDAVIVKKGEQYINNIRYDLRSPIDHLQVQSLIQYKGILNSKLNCEDCIGLELETIISRIQRILYK